MYMYVRVDRRVGLALSADGAAMHTWGSLRGNGSSITPFLLSFLNLPMKLRMLSPYQLLAGVPEADSNNEHLYLGTCTMSYIITTCTCMHAQWCSNDIICSLFSFFCI